MKTRLAIHLPLLALLCCAPPALAAPPADPLAALAEGNDQAAAGKLDQAAAAYLEGYDPAAIHPTLAYNLGSTLHQLGRLPEAILWYRRAAPAGRPGADPWLEDNLLLARRTLGSQNAGHPNAWAGLRRQAGLLTGAAILLSWLAAGLFLLAPRRRGLALAGLAAAVLLAATAWLAHGRGAREAVLLADCATGAGSLPAGSELWVTRDGADFRVAGSRDATCPAAAVALVHPD
jgi:hypothetical protein